MKKITLLFIGLALLFFAVNSCKKSDINGFPSGKGLIEGSYLTLTSAGNDTLDWNNFTAGTVSLTVGSYGEPVASVNVYVVLGANTDHTTWKLIKNLPFTAPLAISVTGSEVATALGVDPKSINQNLTIYTEAVTADGRKFSAADGSTPSNFVSLAGYNMAFIFPIVVINAPCPYDQSYFNGKFDIVSDGWNDYAKGDPIQVTPGPGTNQITLLLYPAPGVGTNRKAIVANVDPLTDSLTVPKQQYGDYGGDFISAQGVGILSNCSGIISLTLDHTDASGDYGIYTVVMKKE